MKTPLIDAIMRRKYRRLLELDGVLGALVHNGYFPLVLDLSKELGPTAAHERLVGRITAMRDKAFADRREYMDRQVALRRLVSFDPPSDPETAGWTMIIKAAGELLGALSVPVHIVGERP